MSNFVARYYLLIGGQLPTISMQVKNNWVD